MNANFLVLCLFFISSFTFASEMTTQESIVQVTRDKPFFALEHFNSQKVLSILKEAQDAGNAESIASLINETDVVLWKKFNLIGTLLSLAVQVEDLEFIEFLIPYSINTKDLNGNTALWQAVNCDREAGFNILAQSPKVNPNTINNWGESPLHHALIKGKNHFLAKLIVIGANPNIKTNGNGPIYVNQKERDGNTKYRPYREQSSFDIADEEQTRIIQEALELRKKA